MEGHTGFKLQTGAGHARWPRFSWEKTEQKNRIEVRYEEIVSACSYLTEPMGPSGQPFFVDLGVLQNAWERRGKM